MSQQVELRAPGRDDAEPLADLLNDQDTASWRAYPYPAMLVDAKAMLEANDHRTDLYVIQAADALGPGRFAGVMTVRSNGAASADVEFAVHPAYRRRGIATEALRLLAARMLTDTETSALTWCGQVGDHASWRVAWRNGFNFVATVPAAIDRRGEPQDAWVATLGRDDPREPQTTWMRPIRMEVDGLVIRDLDPKDETRFVEAMTDPESMRWLGTIPGMPRTREAFRDMFLRHHLHPSLGESVGWTVADRDTDEYLASISLFGFGGLDYKSAEVGYRTHPSARGRGVLTRSLRAVIAHAFAPEEDDGLGLERIHLGAGDGNAGSLGVARSLGFTETGRDRHCYDLDDGSIVDLIRFDLLRSEFG